MILKNPLLKQLHTKTTNSVLNPQHHNFQDNLSKPMDFRVPRKISCLTSK